jgi:phospholipid transport system substrate-binding protein
MMLLLASTAVPSHATERRGETPSAFVTKLVNKAILFANSGTLSSADRQKRLEYLLNESFDMQRIASFVLGRYWKTATATERQDFTAVFRDFMIRVYSNLLTDYSNGSFRVIDQRTESTTSAVVYTEIGSPASGQRVKVEWRVINLSGYRVVDMSVSGISLALTKREEFASYIQRNGDLSSLIERLRAIKSAQQSR